MMRYEVNANTFMQLPYTTGTIQNVSNTDIEISNEQTIGTGIVLKAGETFAFNNATVYACARPVLNGGTGIISVVPFNGEGEGGESPIYVPKGSIAFASLPTTLNSTMLGWTYNVSDSFTTDSRFIEGAGVDYPAGENVVVVEPTTGTFKYDCFGGAYILPVANTTILGGVKSSAADGKVSVDNSGVMTINLPTASTAVKGGIKVGKGVEVDANQKLNVTAATSSIIGGVKSSNNEGKVSVNNDGTMTYNPRGYRQPSTIYAVGDIKYHSALPTGWYLECTTAGTSGSGDLTISSPSIGGTVADGTVVWTISSNLSLLGGILYSSTIKRNDSNSALVLRGGDSSETGGYISLRGSNNSSGPGTVVIQATTGGVNFSNIVLSPNGSLMLKGYDLGGSAIVAKSIGTNGYIKYASGLIMQWGAVSEISTTEKTIAYPIAFSTYGAVVAFGYACYVELRGYSITGFTVKSNNSTVGTGLRYIAIGY